MKQATGTRLGSRAVYVDELGETLRAKKFTAITAAILLLGTSTARADLLDLLGQFSNDVERESAVATQAVYDQLKTAGCSDFQVGPTTACGGSRFLVWRNVREVVHNANALTPNETSGSILFSLGRANATLLGRALQWCNGEEFAAMGSLASSFTGTQTANLAARITALRFGSNGFRLASSDFDKRGLQHGGGASADSEALTSAWSGFINGDYTAGDREVTQRENAFDFIGRHFSAGIDKRLNDHWVTGAVLGYQNQTLNFVDVLPGATVNVVDADTHTNGASLMPFILYQNERWFFNASLGYEQLKFDSNRHVNYASGTLATTLINHNTEDDGDTHSHTWSSYETLGYSWQAAPALSIEPSLSVDYRHITIDQFTESDLQNDGFNFTVDKQNIESLEAIPELHIQYSFTPRFGVWTPYIDAQWHKQFKDKPRVIHALYAGAADSLNSDAKFSIETDAQDSSYQVYTAGFSAALSSAQRGGVQVYANYRWYQQLEHFSLHSLSAGLRYEF